MKTILATTTAILLLPSCSTDIGREIGAVGFVGKRAAAGVEMPFGRIRPGVALTLDRTKVAPDADEGEFPFLRRPGMVLSDK